MKPRLASLGRRCTENDVLFGSSNTLHTNVHCPDKEIMKKRFKKTSVVLNEFMNESDNYTLQKSKKIVFVF